MSSNTRSAVEDELSPSFSSSRATVNPSRTTKAPIRPSSSRAKTRIVDAWEPLVIHCLAPVMRPSAKRVVIAEASEPDPASVSANAPISSPAASAGT